MKNKLSKIMILSLVLAIFSCDFPDVMSLTDNGEAMQDIGKIEIAIINNSSKIAKELNFQKYSNKKIMLDIDEKNDSKLAESFIELELESKFKEFNITEVFIDKEVKNGITNTIYPKRDFDIDITILISGTYKDRGFFFDSTISYIDLIMKETDLESRQDIFNRVKSTYKFKYHMLTNRFSIFLFSLLILIFLIAFTKNTKK